MTKTTLSHAATAVLQAVAEGYRHGFDVIGATGLPSGTVYPALRRLEDTRLVKSAWENARIAQEAQRPPRKYYEVTALGRETLAAALARYRLLDPQRFRSRRLKPSKAES
jgi:DNA-binding PadR family transcriptional regulator